MKRNIESINAITLITKDMAKSVSFYKKLGFELSYGGEEAVFTTFHVGNQSLNLSAESDYICTHWGRLIFHVNDVDLLYKNCIDQGLTPQFSPRNAPWRERYFHIYDPDGHEISFAVDISGNDT